MASESAEISTREYIEVMVPLVLAADRAINPGRWVLSVHYDNLGESRFTTRDDALTWMGEWAGAIRGCVRIAHETHRHEIACSLVEGFWGWLTISKDWQMWRTVHEMGLAPASHCDSTVQARMLSGLGSLNTWLGDLHEAERLHMRARALWVQSKHKLGQATCMESLGVLNLKRNKPLAARSWFNDARLLFSEAGRTRGAVMMGRRLGESFRDGREFDQADKQPRGALDWFRDQDDDYMVLRTGRSLALYPHRTTVHRRGPGVAGRATADRGEAGCHHRRTRTLPAQADQRDREVRPVRRCGGPSSGSGSVPLPLHPAPSCPRALPNSPRGLIWVSERRTKGTTTAIAVTSLDEQGS